jgi:lysophospholipase L1-like esterase
METSSLGCRGPEIPLEKPQEVKRVLMIGDSSTYGESVRFEDTYAHRLEKMLNASAGSKNWQVINAGVPGYTSFQGCRLLRRYESMQPDILVVYFGANDVFRTDVADAERTFPMGPQWDFVLMNLEKSYFYHLFRKLIFLVTGTLHRNPESRGKGEGVCRVSPQEFEKNLSEMVRISKKLGCEIFLMTSVGRDQEKLYNLKQVLNYQIEGAHVIDLDVPFRSQTHDLDGLFIDNVHPTPAGHDLIAKAIWEAFVRAGISLTDSAESASHDPERPIPSTMR